MKYAILGDIHANLEALEAVIEHAAAQGVTDYISTGDVVGYNSDPEACIEVVRNLCSVVVKGNHDHYAATEDSMENFSPTAAAAIEWTRNRLSAGDREWLQALPLRREVEMFTLTHSSLNEPEAWHYVLDRAAAVEHFTVQKNNLCFIGHTHVPVVFQYAETLKFFRYERMHPQPGCKYILNVGSVGQPRDKDCRAAYVTYDLLSNCITLHRVAYDYQKTQRKIRQAGLPEKNARRLEFGQ
jgi:diadenosine tetraphosphatase ApaH/serine/threonine PP2A family protein phosphatase